MKAIFIQNYKVTEAIASRVHSFESWSIEKRPGDGIISPVSVIKSVDGESVLITYDRTAESTNSKSPFDASLDDELANNWFNDMRSKDNVEVFKELGGGLIMYVDNGKSDAAIETFISKMNSVRGIDNVGLEAIKPLVRSEADWQKFLNMIPTYEELAKYNKPANEEIKLESVEPEQSYDDIDENPDSIYLDEGFTDDLTDNANTPVVNNDPVSFDLPEELSNNFNNDDLSTGDVNTDDVYSPIDTIQEPPEDINNIEDTIEPNDDPKEPEVQSVPTEPDVIETTGFSSDEIQLVRDLASYLTENNLTLNELLSSINKLKMVVNQLYKNNNPETVQSNMDDESEPIDNIDTEVPVETPVETNPIEENSIDKFTQNLLNTADNLESEPVKPTNLNDVDTDNNTSIEEPTEPIYLNENNDIEEPINEPLPIDNEVTLMESAIHNSKNDNEFFEFLLPYKDKLSVESINRLVNIKMYDYLLTGVEFQNIIAVRQERAEKLGLL